MHTNPSKRMPVLRLLDRRKIQAALTALALIVSATFVEGVGMRPASSASFAVVTFAENATPDDSTVVFETEVGSVPLTLFNNLTPPFVNPGYTFDNWNTVDDGAGTTYADGAVYNFSLGDIILYAQWTENSVTFHENRTGLD